MTHLTSELLTDFAHGELSPGDDARAHAHIAACGACRAAYELEIALSERLRRAAATSEREMPSLVNAAVWQAIRARRPSPLASLASFFRPAFALPLTAAFVVGGFFASSLAPTHRAPSISASYYLESHAAQAGTSPLSERTPRAAALVAELPPSIAQ